MAVGAGRRGRRRLVVAALAGFVLATAAGHWLFWYRPRLRARVPNAGDSAVATVLAGNRGGAALWVAYPHQNLGVLRGERGETLAELVPAVARLAGAGGAPPRLRFGPFGLPPASQLGVSGEGGAPPTAVVDLYPTAAGLARLSGWLAGNPWLAGGVVRAAGRDAVVSWRGARWQLAATSPPAIGPRGERLASGATALADQVDDTPALALARIDEPPGWLPAGLYRLEPPVDGVLRLVRLGSPAPPSPAAAGVAARLPQGLAVCVLVRDAEGVAGLLIGDGGDGGSLPTVVAVGTPPTRADLAAWSRPLRQLVRAVGRPATLVVGAWGAAGVDRGALAEMDAVLPSLAAMADALGTAAGRWAWVRPAGVVPVLDRLLGLAGSLGPLVPRGERQRLEDLRQLAGVARPLAGVELRVDGAGGAAAWGWLQPPTAR